MKTGGGEKGDGSPLLLAIDEGAVPWPWPCAPCP